MPLVVCGVPIGNLADASPRLAATLGSADVVAAEDTRRLARLCRELGVRPVGRVVSYYDAVEAARLAGLLAELAAGRTVALVSDAGMPAVSDPGYRLVAAAAAGGYPVSVVPGPSALTAALAVSGLPSDRVAFEGFLPRTAGPRRRRLAELAGEPRTLVLLEAARRLPAALAELAQALGTGRAAVLCRELTKTYEQVLRAGLGELAETARSAGWRGEVTLVIAGAEADRRAATADPATLVHRVAALQRAGLDRSSATGEAAREAGVRRSVVFDALLAAKRAGVDH